MLDGTLRNAVPGLRSMLMILLAAMQTSCTIMLWDSLGESIEPVDASFDLTPDVRHAAWAATEQGVVIVLELDPKGLGELLEPWRRGRLRLFRDGPSDLVPAALGAGLCITLESRWYGDPVKIWTQAKLSTRFRAEPTELEAWEVEPAGDADVPPTQNAIARVRVQWEHARKITPSAIGPIALRVLATPVTVALDVTLVGLVFVWLCIDEELTDPPRTQRVRRPC